MENSLRGHCGTGVGKGRDVRLDRSRQWLIRGVNPLALYALSGKLTAVAIINSRPGQLK